MFVCIIAGSSEQLCPERVLLSRPVVQAALGEHHGLLLTQEGQVYSFGELLWRDLRIPASHPVLEVTLLGEMVVRVAAGGFHCGALSEQGSVYMWGENTAGQCGLTERVSEPCPVSVVDNDVVPPAVIRVVDLACGREHSLALSSQNELWAWGSGCQLGLVISTFPVSRPQKVVCGAYHSLALVRSLPPQKYNTHNPPKKRERGQSPHCSVPEREELVTVDDSHYCPLGVELSEVMTDEVYILKQRQITDKVINEICGHGEAEPLTQPDGTPMLCPLSGWRANKNSVFPDEVELQSLLQKLSGSSLETQQTTGPGDTDSLSSHTSYVFLSGSPRRRQPCACKPSSTGQTQAPTLEEAGEGLLSLETEVWSWGRGSEGQLGHGDQLARLQPLCIKSLTGEEVIKVAAGSHHSLALTAQCQVYSWGSNMCGQLGHINSPVTVPQQAKLSDGLRVWDMSAGQSHSLLLADGDCVQPILLYCGQQQEPMSMGYINSVCSGGQSCALLLDHNIMGFISAIHELASRERHFYCWLSNVKKCLLTPLRNRGETVSLLAASLWMSFVRLSVLIGRHATSLSYFLHNLQVHNVTSLPLLVHTEHFLDIYKEYCSAVGNFQVMGGFQTLHKLSIECLGSQQAMLAQLCVADQPASEEANLVSLMYWPLQHLQQYSRALLKMAACYDVVRVKLLCCFCLFAFYVTQTVLLRRYKCVFILQEVLRLPQRRVVCESTNRSLTLLNAGRFSNHWFILFNDALVHTQFSTHHVYPLTCLWNKWLQSLNQAVDQVLGGGVQSSSPVLTAMSRTASYTFTGEGRFKDAQYTGGWLAGRIHGRGTMKWPDGRIYKGIFKNGLENGYGECIIPNKVLNKPDIYEGHWKDGKIHGFGKYKYASGEVYEGCFCDDQRHGYGMLSSGKLARNSSSVFIGQWVQDRKTGYGVYDDITRGEKYMGLWLDDQRHGSTVVVTQYGLYYEGTFKENKMAGSGLLLSDDDTVFHGEFSEDWTINGKGVLSLTNGDSLEGLFSGEWSTGLKVVGTYTKPTVAEPESKDRKNLFRMGQYVVPADQRWGCVFDECWSRLGCDAAGRGERATAWENIAVAITTARRHSPDLSRSQSKVLESLEFIPQHGEPVTTTNYDNIRRYLLKACETPLHPLGWLVETLVTVYRMTYVGVGSNRRLLRQAVQEVQAYLTHFYSIVRFLFPGLPDDGGIIPDPPGSPTKSRCNSNAADQGCSSLLLPLLLPRLYPPLFTLYCLQVEQEEAQYWERILRLNKQPDQSLLSFLEVQEVFLLLSQIVSSTKEACFVSAVETLQQISTTFTPSDKLLVIHKTFVELTQEVKPMLDGDFLWCMDDLFPLFLYVVLRARIRNLGAEVSLIEDLMDPNIQHGEMGLMFTTLKACYIQIQHETNT
uniref:Alsin-like n=1 Tax=Mastacembelus armatus TaxID=205130 RepID=A0A7N8XQ27_9TELE